MKHEWTNFARNFWFYYPSLMLISESSKYCKENSLQSSSTVNSPSSTSVSTNLSNRGNIDRSTITNSNNNDNNNNHHQVKWIDVPTIKKVLESEKQIINNNWNAIEYQLERINFIIKTKD
ncbi:hypothetical protein ACTFIW_006130 [Dictyostelium discoideum]